MDKLRYKAETCFLGECIESMAKENEKMDSYFSGEMDDFKELFTDRRELTMTSITASITLKLKERFDWYANFEKHIPTELQDYVAWQAFMKISHGLLFDKYRGFFETVYAELEKNIDMVLEGGESSSSNS